jgi:sugar/nucleoside kinase (ribokinase family)
VLVCSLGDLTLDVVVRLARPLALEGDSDAEIRVGAGGQAANVAAWAATLGARSRFIGKTGLDDAGQLARTRLDELGVEVAGPVAGRNGTICSLVDASGGRSMAADRGSARDLRADEIEAVWLSDCKHLHVSGYALMLDPVRSAAERAVALARETGARVSIDLASWSAIEDSGVEAFRDAVRRVGPDVVFSNEDEERVVGRVVEAAWIVKRGAGGCSFDGDEREALPVEAIDSTGAGDALAAGWIVGGPDLALEAAARCVQRLGAMPR